MTREEAIKALRLEGGLEISGSARRLAEFMQGLDVALTALRGPTREMVERMRGCSDCQRKTCVSCRRFGRVPERCVDCSNQDKWSPWNFCPVCGKPLTDEAVDMMMGRWREAIDDETD